MEVIDHGPNSRALRVAALAKFRKDLLAEAGEVLISHTERFPNLQAPEKRLYPQNSRRKTSKRVVRPALQRARDSSWNTRSRKFTYLLPNILDGVVVRVAAADLPADVLRGRTAFDRPSRRQFCEANTVETRREDLVHLRTRRRIVDVVHVTMTCRLEEPGKVGCCVLSGKQRGHEERKNGEMDKRLTDIGLLTIIDSRLIRMAPGRPLPAARARFCSWMTVAMCGTYVPPYEPPDIMNLFLAANGIKRCLDRS
jgi:hypothetical protein